jgi:dephospho-CoA kinase
MGKLVAVAGLAGAGKTTATDHLESIGLGRRVYVGALVLNEVRRQGLQVGAENEKLVRVALRRSNGPHALAALAAPVVMDILGSGTNVLLDAIFNIEEYRHFEELCGNQVFLLAIAASFDVRADRLQHRCLRALTKDQLKARDETELNVLRTDLVFAEAPYRIVNEGSLDAFKAELERFWGDLSI